MVLFYLANYYFFYLFTICIFLQELPYFFELSRKLPSPELQLFPEQLLFSSPPLCFQKMWMISKFMLDICASLCGAPDYESVLKVVRRALVSRFDFSFYFTRRSHLCSNNGNPTSSTLNSCVIANPGLTLPAVYAGGL